MQDFLNTVKERYPEEADKEWLNYLEEETNKALSVRVTIDLPFLSPYRRQMTEDLLSFKSDIDYMVFGGYPGAKRTRIRFWPADLPVSGIPAVKILALSGKLFREKTGEHDILRLMYMEGFSGDMCGDFLWDGTDSLHFFLAEEPHQKFLKALKEAFPEIVKIEVRDEIDYEKFTFAKTKTIKGTVASMRLDAVASLGWGISRSKAAINIKSGLVSVNWKREKNPSSRVKEKDFIALRSGTGFLIDSLAGKSRKGRENIILKKIY